MKRPTLEQKEILAHGAARYAADSLWFVSNLIDHLAFKTAKLASTLNEYGHKTLDLAINYSERQGEKPHSPILNLTKLPADHPTTGLPPVTLFEESEAIDLEDARRVFVRAMDSNLEQDLQIVNRYDGMIEVGIVATLPVGEYELIIEWDNECQPLSDKIVVTPNESY